MTPNNARPFSMRDPKVVSWLAVLAVATIALGAMFSVSVWIVLAGVASWSWGAMHNSIVQPGVIGDVPKYTWPQGIAVATGVTLVVFGLVAAVLRYTVVIP